MILKPFSAELVRSLDKDDFSLPVSEAARTRLLSILPPGETTLLTLRDDLYAEEIEVENACGEAVIKRRGLGETEVRKFPRGSGLCFEVTVSVVQHLICSYDCCGDGPCPAAPVTVTTLTLPGGKVGQPWTGLAVFGGSAPMQLAVTELPGWVSAEAGENYIRLTGTPPGAGTFGVAVTGTNETGTTAAAQGNFTVTV
jgi:hypothetical protein